MDFANISYNKKFLLLKIENDNFKGRIYLEKSFFRGNNQDQYFIKIYKNNNDGLECLGYIYFYLDLINKTSIYIGTYIKPDYRNQRLASLLTSCWIMLCLDNGIYKLTTNKVQRKPFLLYLLKTFAFELDDITKYDEFKNIIYICQRKDDITKYLMFASLRGQESFMHGKIFSNDNYEIITELDEDTMILDRILLSNVYNCQNNDKSYQRSLKIVDKHKQ